MDDDGVAVAKKVLMRNKAKLNVNGIFEFACSIFTFCMLEKVLAHDFEYNYSNDDRTELNSKNSFEIKKASNNVAEKLQVPQLKDGMIAQCA